MITITRYIVQYENGSGEFSDQTEAKNYAVLVSGTVEEKTYEIPEEPVETPPEPPVIRPMTSQ